jgi:hypothetical protein
MRQLGFLAIRMAMKLTAIGVENLGIARAKRRCRSGQQANTTAKSMQATSTCLSGRMQYAPALSASVSGSHAHSPPFLLSGNLARGTDVARQAWG